MYVYEPLGLKVLAVKDSSDYITSPLPSQVIAKKDTENVYPNTLYYLLHDICHILNYHNYFKYYSLG